MKMNLRFFGDDEQEPDVNADNKETDAKDESTGKEGKQEKSYSQAEFDNALASLRRQLKAESNKAAKKAEVESVAENEPDKTPPDDTLVKENAALRQNFALAEIKAAMATSGIKPEKIERGARLIDITKCLADDMPDTELIKSEIEELLKDFPELKQTDGHQLNGFKIGNASKSETATSDEISKIFGNK